jgi:predicted Zn-dependent peptidase
MMFKGTKRRPTSQDITRDLDSVGADYNAFTGKDYTGYYIKLDAAHTGLAVDMLHDMIFHSTYKKEECDRERQVILEEINMYEDNPMMHAEELLEAVTYGSDTPLGRLIAGTHKTMNGIKREMLTKFRDHHYVPEKTVLAVAGKIDGGIMKLLEATFGRIPKAGQKPKPFAKAARKAGGPRLELKFKDTDQVQFAVGFPGYPFRHRKLPALSVLATVLGGGMSSRLFTEVRERRGLAYSVSADMSPFQDVGNFAVFAGLNKAKLNEGIGVILRELDKIAKHGITAEELNRAKEYIKGKTVLRLEASSALAEFFAKQELMSKSVESPEEKIAKILAVKADEVKAVAREIFQTKNLSAALIGPFKDKKPFMKLLRFV